MRSVGLGEVPIVMAGGVWHLSDWENWIDNPELGPIAFQFGTRPSSHQRKSYSKSLERKVNGFKKGEIKLHKFSPTGFYSYPL